jgi:GSH-dependent disulfide-bond oxidoreductase
MIDCYAWKTGNGRKALLALAESGLAHRIIPIDISTGAQKTPEFTRINPNQVIPAIVDHDAAGGPLALFESGAIVLYVAEKSGRLMPSTASARGRAYQWMFWHAATFMPAVTPLHLMAQGRLPKEPAAERAALDRARALYEMMERRLGESVYLADDEYGIADVMLAPMLTRRAWHGIELDALPNVKRWYEAIIARPAAREVFSDAPLK